MHSGLHRAVEGEPLSCEFSTDGTIISASAVPPAGLRVWTKGLRPPPQTSAVVGCIVATPSSLPFVHRREADIYLSAAVCLFVSVPQRKLGGSPKIGWEGSTCSRFPTAVHTFIQTSAVMPVNSRGCIPTFGMSVMEVVVSWSSL